MPHTRTHPLSPRTPSPPHTHMHTLLPPPRCPPQTHTHTHVPPPPPLSQVGEVTTWEKLPAIQCNCTIEATLDKCLAKITNQFRGRTATRMGISNRIPSWLHMPQVGAPAVRAACVCVCGGGGEGLAVAAGQARL